MTILGIETSCDETGIALVRANSQNTNITLLKNEVATSLALHATTGGIIPENAAREQLKVILPVLKKVLKDMSPQKNIDAISVTVGPGLIGSLLVGVETAKTLSYLWNKPLIPVNHLFGHIYANWLTEQNTSHIEKNLQPTSYTPRAITFPALALVVSGNHTDLVLMQSHKDISVLGSTRDDAAGEAFDKIGRLLGLSYPAGPMISKLAEKGNEKAYNFPRPLMHSGDFDFSFSGLKTAVLREVKTIEHLDHATIENLCASTQTAIVEVLVHKTLKAAKEHNIRSILLGGGVAANEKLRKVLTQKTNDELPMTNLFFPKKEFCTDNGAMIAAAAFFRKKTENFEEIIVDPELYY